MWTDGERAGVRGLPDILFDAVEGDDLVVLAAGKWRDFDNVRESPEVHSRGLDEWFGVGCRALACLGCLTCSTWPSNASSCQGVGVGVMNR